MAIIILMIVVFCIPPILMLFFKLTYSFKNRYPGFFKGLFVLCILGQLPLWVFIGGGLAARVEYRSQFLQQNFDKIFASTWLGMYFITFLLALLVQKLRQLHDKITATFTALLVGPWATYIIVAIIIEASPRGHLPGI